MDTRLWARCHGDDSDDVIQDSAGCRTEVSLAWFPNRSGGSSVSRTTLTRNMYAATLTRVTPGAFMDRSVLEGDPMPFWRQWLLPTCTGSNQGYIYVRAEYPIAVERLKIAIEQAREMETLSKKYLRNRI